MNIMDTKATDMVGTIMAHTITAIIATASSGRT
jgi:hypothetical protein